MPMVDLRITLVVGPGGQGGSDHAITFTVPANGASGFTPTTAQLNKLGLVVQKFADAIDNNATPL